MASSIISLSDNSELLVIVLFTVLSMIDRVQSAELETVREKVETPDTDAILKVIDALLTVYNEGCDPKSNDARVESFNRKRKLETNMSSELSHSFKEKEQQLRQFVLKSYAVESGRLPTVLCTVTLNRLMQWVATRLSDISSLAMGKQGEVTSQSTQSRELSSENVSDSQLTLHVQNAKQLLERSQDHIVRNPMFGMLTLRCLDLLKEVSSIDTDAHLPQQTELFVTLSFLQHSVMLNPRNQQLLLRHAVNSDESRSLIHVLLSFLRLLLRLDRSQLRTLDPHDFDSSPATSDMIRICGFGSACLHPLVQRVELLLDCLRLITDWTSGNCAVCQSFLSIGGSLPQLVALLLHIINNIAEKVSSPTYSFNYLHTLNVECGLSCFSLLTNILENSSSQGSVLRVLSKSNICQFGKLWPQSGLYGNQDQSLASAVCDFIIQLSSSFLKDLLESEKPDHDANQISSQTDNQVPAEELAICAHAALLLHVLCLGQLASKRGQKQRQGQSSQSVKRSDEDTWTHREARSQSLAVRRKLPRNTFWLLIRILKAFLALQVSSNALQVDHFVVCLSALTNFQSLDAQLETSMQTDTNSTFGDDKSHAEFSKRLLGSPGPHSATFGSRPSALSNATLRANGISTELWAEIDKLVPAKGSSDVKRTVKFAPIDHGTASEPVRVPTETLVLRTALTTNTLIHNSADNWDDDDDCGWVAAKPSIMPVTKKVSSTSVVTNEKSIGELKSKANVGANSCANVSTAARKVVVQTLSVTQDSWSDDVEDEEVWKLSSKASSQSHSRLAKIAK